MKYDKFTQDQNQKPAKTTQLNASADLNQSIFSKPHNTHEDRGEHQMKTSRDSQTLFRICALL
jgi:hypothetical protein